MKTFHIKHSDKQIILETESTQFKSLQDLMLVIGSHFIEKGKINELNLIVNILQSKLVGKL